MTIAQRRWLLASFILIFAFCGPLIVLYASGYRYNTRLRKIEQVGVLSLSTKQSDSIVLVDAKPYHIRRDLLLTGLRPRSYEIVVTKEGYHPWTKQLTIQEGRTTFANSLWLFPDTLPDPVELFANPLLLLDEDQELAVYQGNAALVVYHKRDGRIVEHELPQGELPATQARLHKESLVFAQGGSWYIADAASDPLLIKLLPVPPGTTLVQTFGNTRYAATASAVLEWRNDAFVPLFSLANVQAIWPNGKAIWAISAEATGKRCFLYEVSSPNVRPQFSVALPFSEAWEIVGLDGTLMTIHDGQQNRLFLVDTRSAPAAVVTLEGVFDWQWSGDRRALLTATANEVAIYHVENGTTQELIVRQGEPIVDAAWGPDESWVLYATDSSIYAAERDHRDRRNIIKLASEKKQPHLLRLDADVLRFSSLQGDAFVIWELPIDGE